MSTSQAASTLTRAPLADVMLAMDVVDTLRHSQGLVSRELGAEQRRNALIERLREIYRGQGIEVSDAVLAQGVDALEEERFRYAPPAASLSTSLAKLYVRRHLWLRPALLVFGVLLVVWLFYYLLAVRPESQQRASLPSRIDTIFAQIVNVSSDPSAMGRAQDLVNLARGAISEDNFDIAQARYDELRALRRQLDSSYELRIVVDPRENSGVWRVPSVNARVRNYYLIVEAIHSGGDRQAVLIQSEEDGLSRVVERWGVRVDEQTFESVAADKQDDGIIQNNVIGKKHRGQLEPEYFIPVLGGTILEW